jgi:protein required for attachment to host cells
MESSTCIWYCIADAGQARILQAAAPRATLSEVQTLMHEPYEHGRHEPPGRSQESATTARHSFVDPETPARREKRSFAGDVAHFLDAAAERNAYGQLVIAAPPQFLGDLRAALGRTSKSRLKAEIAKDLTHEALRDLAAHLTKLTPT